MKTIQAYLTKGNDGELELWNSEPHREKSGEWYGKKHSGEVGSDILDFDNEFEDWLKPGECIKIKITKL